MAGELYKQCSRFQLWRNSTEATLAPNACRQRAGGKLRTTRKTELCFLTSRDIDYFKDITCFSPSSGVQSITIICFALFYITIQ